GGGKQDLAVPAALQERRPNDSRTDHAHPDASRRSLDPQRIRECEDGVLRGTVARHERRRYEALDRCGVDDVAESLCEHLAIRRRDAVDDPAEIHVDDATPVFDRVVTDLTQNADP